MFAWIRGGFKGLDSLRTAKLFFFFNTSRLLLRPEQYEPVCSGDVTILMHFRVDPDMIDSQKANSSAFSVELIDDPVDRVQVPGARKAQLFGILVESDASCHCSLFM
jgi:hypothetical protein